MTLNVQIHMKANLSAMSGEKAFQIEPYMFVHSHRNKYSGNSLNFETGCMAFHYRFSNCVSSIFTFLRVTIKNFLFLRFNI